MKRSTVFYLDLFFTRKTLVLLPALLFTFFPNVNAQDKNINLNLSNVTLDEVMRIIEKNTDYVFYYNNSGINLSKKISLKVYSTDINDILVRIIPDYKYSIENNKIIILPKSDTLIDITGIVSDEDGKPIAGASIVEKGIGNMTVSNSDGIFKLRAFSNSKLAVSYIGFESRDISVNNKSNFRISLNEENKILDEVVIVGYGAARKNDLTGAVSTIGGKDIASRQTIELASALQGATSGILITRDNSAPGTIVSDIKVRGITSLSNSNPLVIIDGVPGDINRVNPNDVEAISVLKDAASSAIYGARAAAGVILITTKRATENKLSLNYTGEYGWEKATTLPKHVDVQRYLEMTNELRYNDNPSGGLFQAYSEDQVNDWVKNNTTEPNRYPITNWEKLLLKNSASRQTHMINASGSNGTLGSKASFRYDNIDGLYNGLNYQRYLININNDIKINNYFKASFDVYYKHTKKRQPTTNPFYDAGITAPVFAAMWDDGRIAEGKSGKNPYGALKEGGFINLWYTQFSGKASLTFTPAKGLSIQAVIAPTMNFEKQKNFRKAIPYTLMNNPDIIGGYLENYSTTKLTERRNDSRNITSQIIANYITKFNNHNVNLTMGYEDYYVFNEVLSASRDQFETTDFPYLDSGPQILRDNGGSASEMSYRSWFGRVIYSYANKYLLQANIRYDGSSRLAKKYRWGTFASFSGGWVITEEPFMQNIKGDWLSFLKLRGSWGTLGNERLYSYYPSEPLIQFSNTLFYQNGLPVSELTAAQWQYVIESISWEKTNTVDFGLDASFFDNRLRLSADYYYKKTTDMLLALEIPSYVGFDNPQKNTGDMNTKGYDIELGWKEDKGDFKYSVSINFSDFISKMGNLGGTQFLDDRVKIEGSQYNEWYGYITEGLYLNQNDLDNSAKINNNIAIGDVKYKDISGPDGVPDGRISPEYDRVLLGGSLPRYIYGGNISVQYKNMDISMAFQGIGKRKVRMTRNMIEPLRDNWGHIPAIIDGNYWSPNNTAEQNSVMKYPRLSRSNVESNYAMSDLWLFEGRYFRMKNITLGYSLPSEITKKIRIDNIRIYASANDLFSFDKYPKGWDPEVGGGAYPITRSVLFGISLNF